jgi:hypothetical protein
VSPLTDTKAEGNKVTRSKECTWGCRKEEPKKSCRWHRNEKQAKTRRGVQEERKGVLGRKWRHRRGRSMGEKLKRGWKDQKRLRRKIRKKSKKEGLIKYGCE